ncbi:GntR family transcriptional regulator [Weizmannia acidilactici]|uniref:GntR family transcriptional regulator n=1 Tax=Weizmannia acidilactici TaxID=2607726 RepID=A0A5J4J5N0_9BACI|nr:PLP-dependent aminotransferase family protein [Weizmannia acidilactici]GER66533.1 GntR family transcriptional regulator [Weizmannia acidilactici]GER70246.1 GntR family transcriptional regulator [Weizmannia acidilactici]GER74553.1 GntR family transcriptional regulator [Weizmannia acidilactici]
MFEITPHLDPKHQTPLYIQLYKYILNEIEADRIPQGTKLPSIRKLAAHLELGKNTVDAAYQQLAAEGYIESKPGSGYYVADLDRQLLTVPKHGACTINIPELKKPLPNHIRYDFRHGNIDTDNFPFADWKKISNQVLFEKDIFSYGDRQGEPELRLEIAKYLYESRGVSCSPEQIIIGGGIQQLISLLCFIIGVKDKGIAVENPGYDGARAVFLHHGFQLKSIGIDQCGLKIAELEQSRARFVYVTPSHQFPMGMIMPIANRMKLLQWANRVDGFIIEDDYDSEFRYRGKPIPALQGIDPNGRVIYLGTFSKALLPSIRVAYMVLPEALINKFNENFQSYEQPVSKILQKTLCLFMRQGYWQKHLRKMRHIYQKKHEVLFKAVHEHMGNNVRMIGENSGLHVIMEVKKNDTEDCLIQKARNAGVRVYPTSKYWMNGRQTLHPQLLLGFAGLSEKDIQSGIKILSGAWF